MSKYVDEGDPHNGLVLPEPSVGDHGAEDGEKVDQHRKDVEIGGGIVLAEVELGDEVDAEDGWKRRLQL